MSTRANPAVIGFFVVGAIILAVAGLLIFGSGRLFKKVDRFVVFFSGSVDGLEVGAPVKFRGVRIGSVKDIELTVNVKSKDFFVKVLLETERGKASFTDGKVPPTEMFNLLIQKGLRAQLRSQSFVTGLLFVALDTMPDVPAVYYGFDKTVPEIPAAPTDLEMLKNTLTSAIEQFQKIPIQKIGNNIESILEGMNKFVNAPDLKNAVRSLNSAINRADTLIESLEKEIHPLARQFQGTTSETRRAIANLNTQLKPMADSLKKAADAASAALAQLQSTLAMKEGVPGNLAASILSASAAAQKALQQTGNTMQGLGSQDTQLQFMETLKEMREAARSIRMLTDYLEQHPESVIRGKPGKGEK